MTSEVIHNRPDFEPVLVLPVTALPNRKGAKGGKRYGLVLDDQTIETVGVTLAAMIREWVESFEARSPKLKVDRRPPRPGIGTNQPHKRFTDADVDYIRANPDGLTWREFMAKYSCSRDTLWKVKTGQTYSS